MNAILMKWNELPQAEAIAHILPCCGSRRWAERLAAGRPFEEAKTLFTTSDKIWHALDPSDWDEAFSSHPRIGATKAPTSATTQSAEWSSQEQRRVTAADPATQERLRQANAAYETRFGRIYIVCATGKTAEELLAMLEQRLLNEDVVELYEAAEQQRQITQLRLRKWLQL